MGAWRVECIGCQPTQLTHMTQVNVQRGDHVLIVVQDRALIKQNLRPTVGHLKKMFWSPSGEKQKTFGGNRQGKGFLRYKVLHMGDFAINTYMRRPPSTRHLIYPCGILGAARAGEKAARGVPRPPRHTEAEGNYL
jgi:hypothetical protein